MCPGPFDNNFSLQSHTCFKQYISSLDVVTLKEGTHQRNENIRPGLTEPLKTSYSEDLIKSECCYSESKKRIRGTKISGSV